MKTYHVKSINKQKGAALAVGLILLLIITLMGYTGMKSTMLQEKMAAGLHNKALANLGAHSALREGEKFLYNLIDNTNGVQATGTPNGNLFKIYSMYQEVGDPESGKNITVEQFKGNDWTTVSGTETQYSFTGITQKGAALSVEPQYMIQHIRNTAQDGSIFSSGGSSSNGSGTTHEFGAGGGSGSGGGGGGSGGSGTNQDTYLITAKSRSGDGNSFSIVESVYTVVTSSSPTN